MYQDLKQVISKGDLIFESTAYPGTENICKKIIERETSLLEVKIFLVIVRKTLR